MKKLLTIFLVVAFAFSAQAQEPPKQIFFGGVNYDETVVVSAGVAIKLAGGLYEFTYANIGDYGSLSAELGYMFDFGKLFVAPLAGPNAEWVETSEQQPIISYIVGASGLVAGYNLSDKIGLWGYGKYKFKFVDETLFPEGYVFGAGVFVKF